MPKDRTQNNLENNLDGFERVLRALILAGMDPKDAVKVAYHRYPVMRHLYKDLLDDLVGDFAKGYGKKQAAAKFEREAISAAMKKSWTDDGVNLSERMYKNSKKVQAESAEVIGKAIKEGESAAKTAKKLFDGYGKGGIIPEQDIPEFIQEVKDLPVPDWLDEEAVAEWKAAIRHARKLIEQGTTPELRAAYSEVMDAIENGAKQNVSKAIDTAIQEKTRYTAERIVRTERARAYADGVMAKYLDDPDIVAFQWKLSDRHPKCDICDVYAHADLYGLGKGIFPKDKFPKLPAHPHCLCRIKPIVDGMIDMSRQKDNVDKGGKAYIDTLPKREQERLLGVHGKKDVMSGKKEWHASARGVSKEGFEVRKPTGKDNVLQEPSYRGILKSEIIDKTNEVHPKIPLHSEPNTAVRHLSKCGPGEKQENITFYNEKGDMCLQIHFGHHRQPKNHNVGTDDKPDYWHKHEYKIVKNKKTGKDEVRKSKPQALTDVERSLKS